MNGFAAKVVAARDAILAEDESLTSINPGDVAERMLKKLKASDRESLLRMILPDAVRRVLNDPPMPTSVPPDPRAQSSASEQDSDQATARNAPVTKNSASLPGPSKRSIAAFYLRPFWAPEFGEQHMLLGYMTAKQVGQVAAYRRKQGVDVTAQAARLDVLKQLMIDEHATHVLDLPGEKVKDILNGGMR